MRNTLSGPPIGAERKTGAIRYAVDFVGPDLANARAAEGGALSATAGKVSDPVVVRNPNTRGVRVDFMLTPGDAEVVELRLELRARAGARLGSMVVAMDQVSRARRRSGRRPVTSSNEYALLPAETPLDMPTPAAATCGALRARRATA